MDYSQNRHYAVAGRVALKLAAVVCLSLVTEAATASVDTAVTLHSEWAYATEGRQTKKLETIVKPELEADLGPVAKLTVLGRIRADTENNIDADDRAGSELREFYIETNFGRSFLTLGKQQIVWGKADGLKVLDVVNPQDWREFILDDFEDSRIPLWTLNAEIPVADSTLQLIAILDQQYHEFAENGDTFNFTSPLLIPSPPPTVPVTIQPERAPKRILKDGDFGFRLSGFKGGWDYSLNYLYHYDDTAVLFRELVVTPSGPRINITPEYKRSHLMGGSFSNAFGDLTLRGELGYSLDRYYTTNDIADNDGVVKNNEIAYVIGLDWFGISEIFVSTQLFQSTLDNHQTGMLRDERDTSLTLLVERSFLNDTLTTRILWLHNLDLDDGLLRPGISYDLNDTVSIRMGADLFYGNQRGLFGQFRDQDRVTTGIEIGI